MKLGNRFARFAFQTHPQPTSTLIHPLDGLKLIFSSLTSVTHQHRLGLRPHPLPLRIISSQRFSKFSRGFRSRAFKAKRMGVF